MRQAFSEPPIRNPLKNDRLNTPAPNCGLDRVRDGRVICWSSRLLGESLERRYVHALAPILFPQKNQGIALQRIAFGQSDLLPFYGSSELVKPAPNRGGGFFQTYSTGFSVFSVGKAGEASLIVLEKLAP